MRGTNQSLLVLLLSSLATVSLFPSTSVVSAEATNDESVQECGMYLAVSSTSTVEAPKWGIYAGKEYQKGTGITPGDLSVQVHNLLGSALADRQLDEYEDYLIAIVEFFEQFLWVPISSGAQFELSHGRTVSAIPGIGVLGAYNPKLTNADWNHSTAYARSAWNEEPGVAHPGRGAYSNFFDVSMRTTERIPAGMEIFLNYGDNWDGEDKEEDEESEEITRSDHNKIDETVAKMIDFFEKHGDDLDEKAKADIYNFLVRDVMAAAAGPKKGAKITALLPSTPEELKNVKDMGGSLTFSQPTTVRPLSWLESYGRCMDNIRPGASTIANAGRGAFATRAMKEGTIVAPVPLIQIPSEDILDMRSVRHVADPEDPDRFVRTNDNVIGIQLLMNYLLGHPESKMMFFPSGAYVGLINHSKEPNAKLAWSSHPNNHRHWFDLDPAELLDEENSHLGLLMEVVATKDIAEGEEVFIDYGEEWQAAWDAHVQEWESLKEQEVIASAWPIRALDLNEEHKNKPFKTLKEQESEPYPENVMMKCFLMVKKPEDEPPINEQGQKVRTWSEAVGEKTTTIDSDNLFDCSISDRDEVDGSWMYSVVWKNKNADTLVKKVPQKAIVFLDKPDTSDQFAPHVFRHYVGIPDDVFPKGPWRDATPEDDEEE